MFKLPKFKNLLNKEKHEDVKVVKKEKKNKKEIVQDKIQRITDVEKPKAKFSLKKFNFFKKKETTVQDIAKEISDGEKTQTKSPLKKFSFF